MSHRALLRTVSGALIDLEDVDPDLIRVTDIARGLAMINRYNGQLVWPYSVAQHSVLVSYACAPADAREGLMHDAPEYLIGDLTRGLKNIPALLDVVFPLESVIQHRMGLKFGYAADIPASVKLADDRMCLTEMRDLFVPPRLSNLLIGQGVVPLPDRIYPWPWEAAEQAFLDRFVELFGGARA